MKYSYEFKKKCVDMYREGRWAETPDGVKDPKNFQLMIRRWVRIEDENGPEALKHQGRDKKWTPEEKLNLVTKVLSGESIQSVAITAGIDSGMLYRWVRRYRESGYNGLVNQKRGRRSKNPDMKKRNENGTKKLNESEYEELIRLRAENEYIKTEIEVLKKEIALREEKWDEQLKAKKQKSSGNLGRKDTN